MTRSTRLGGVALVVASAVSFGTMGVLARVAYDDGAAPVAVLVARFTIAAIAFAVFRISRDRAMSPLPDRRVTTGLALMGFGYFGQSLCFFTAVDHAPPGLVALLLYTYPALVIVLGVVLTGLTITRLAAVACAVAVAGTVMIIGPSASSGEPIGITLALAAAFIYAGYILTGTRVLQHVDAVTASMVIMTTAAVCFVILYLVSPNRPSFPRSAEGWAAILAIAGLCTVVAGLTFLAGLARIGPADASTISTVEPVVGVALSAVVTGEAITAWIVVGGAMVIASVAAISRAAPDAALAETGPAP